MERLKGALLVGEISSEWEHRKACRAEPPARVVIHHPKPSFPSGKWDVNMPATRDAVRIKETAHKLPNLQHVWVKGKKRSVRDCQWGARDW